MAKTGFRSESVSVAGYGVRDASRVLFYEIFRNGNLAIPKYLIDNNLLCFGCASLWRGIIGRYSDYQELRESYKLRECEYFVSDLVDCIGERTGKKIKYALWLADKQDCIDIYGAKESDLEEYPIGDVLLYDAGRDGKLYGYVEPPQPIYLLF